MIVGGAQENTLLTCQGLAERGHDVLLMTGPTRGPEGRLLKERGTAEVRVEEIPSLVRQIAPLGDLRAYRTILRRLRQIGPDVVHTHSSKAGFLGRLAARAAAVPVVVHTIHGLPFFPSQNRLINRFYIWAERYAARRCDVLVSVAEAMTRQAVAASVAKPSKFTTVYSGMNIEPFLAARSLRNSERSRLGYQDGDFVVAKLARLFEYKGHDDLLQAAAAAVQTFPQIRLLFIGEGRLHAALESAARRLGLGERVRFAGLVEPERIPPLLGAADLLVHASLREGLPRAVPQALLAGTPVAAYALDGTPEIVRDGITGLLVAPGDIAGLTSAICRMVSDHDFAARSARAGQLLASQLFPAAGMVSRLECLYRNVMEHRAKCKPHDHGT
jgi:glycosyltransferase involved in cell wall biosynthesis